MRRFILGVTEGIGIGLLLGWNLGVSGLVPNGGLANWAVTIIGISLIIIGGSGVRQRSANER